MKEEVSWSQFKLRLPSDLMRWLKGEAERNHRSVGAEMVHHLEQERKRSEEGGESA